jgi:hypothetical protein
MLHLLRLQQRQHFAERNVRYSKPPHHARMILKIQLKLLATLHITITVTATKNPAEQDLYHQKTIPRIEKTKNRSNL